MDWNNRTYVFFNDEVNRIAQQYDLNESDMIKGIRDALQKTNEKIIDGTLNVTDNTAETVVNICKNVEMLPSDAELIQELQNFYDYYAATKARDRMWNELEFDANDIEIQIKKGEMFVFKKGATLYEKKTRRSGSATYSGFSASIKIAPGTRYRIGQVNYDVPKVIETVPVDNGILYISNKRIVFDGEQKNFSIGLDKVLRIDINGSLLFIYKENAANPKMVELPYPAAMELAAQIMSSFLNDVG